MAAAAAAAVDEVGGGWMAYEAMVNADEKGRTRSGVSFELVILTFGELDLRLVKVDKGVGVLFFHFPLNGVSFMLSCLAMTHTLPRIGQVDDQHKFLTKHLPFANNSEESTKYQPGSYSNMQADFTIRLLFICELEQLNLRVDGSVQTTDV
jgi:hypothetical protein